MTPVAIDLFIDATCREYHVRRGLLAENRTVRARRSAALVEVRSVIARHLYFRTDLTITKIGELVGYKNGQARRGKGCFKF